MHSKVHLTNHHFYLCFHRYGLIKPQKAVSRLAAFNNDSDSDDDPSSKKKVFTGMGEAQKRQVTFINSKLLSTLKSEYNFSTGTSRTRKRSERRPNHLPIRWTIWWHKYHARGGEKGKRYAGKEFKIHGRIDVGGQKAKNWIRTTNWA